MIRQSLPNDEIEQRGEEIYASAIRAIVTKQDEGKFVVIDVGTGDYEIDVDHVKALERALDLPQPTSSAAIELNKQSMIIGSVANLEATIPIALEDRAGIPHVLRRMSLR